MIQFFKEIWFSFFDWHCCKAVMKKDNTILSLTVWIKEHDLDRDTATLLQAINDFKNDGWKLLSCDPPLHLLFLLQIGKHFDG